MKKLVLAALVLLVCASSAQAGPLVYSGAYIRLTDGPGTTNGGEFTVTAANGSVFDEFKTFCIQKNEYLDFSGIFYVRSITGFAEEEENTGDGGIDFISEQTKWIYANYATGYNLGWDSVKLANAVQTALWWLEKEIPDSGLTADANIILEKAWTNGAATGVLNLYYTKIVGGKVVADLSRHAQDLLAPVPEPGSMLLFGSGLVGLAKLARRRRRG